MFRFFLSNRRTNDSYRLLMEKTSWSRQVSAPERSGSEASNIAMLKHSSTIQNGNSKVSG